MVGCVHIDIDCNMAPSLCWPVFKEQIAVCSSSGL